MSALKAKAKRKKININKAKIAKIALANGMKYQRK
jgi:hypothetical protein